MNAPSDYFFKDCDSFYKCANGVPQAFECPPGLYFDPKLNVCNWPENVDCIDDSPETLECMPGMTACILSSEEDDDRMKEDKINFEEMKKH